MGHISREDYILMQEKRAAAAANNGSTNTSKVGFFKLENDGDEAVVRFNYHNDNEFYNDILITHGIRIDGKFRKVNCLRNYNEPIDKCPLCKAGDQNKQRMYVKLIDYVRDENGQVVAQAKTWDRPTSFINTLADKMAEYGDLTNVIFKVRRHGVKGDMKATYSVDMANPGVYNDSIYTKDFSAFEGYNIVGHAIKDMSFEELQGIAGTTTTETPTAAPRKVTY